MIPKELNEQFATGHIRAEAVNAASMAFKKALIERTRRAEFSHHLSYLPCQDKPEEASNHCNGVSGKRTCPEFCV